MEADEISASALFDPAQQLQIPIWQRHYSWEGPQIKELWADIERIQKTGIRSHFLGSIVVKAIKWSGSRKEARRSLIVDGQQRITTLTILVCAIRDRLAQLETDSIKRAALVSEFTSQLLLNANLMEGHQERLVLQDKDQAALRPLIEGRWDSTTNTLVDKAYSYFREKMADYTGPALDELLEIVQTRLTAVWVTIDDADNSHRVFQTLNAGGKKLQQSDLVRNYFFLLLKERGDIFYKSQWQPMETDLGERELSDFMVAWTISQGYTGIRESLFDYFHTDLVEHEGLPVAVLEYGTRFTESARLYRWIRRPSDSPYRDQLLVNLTDIAGWRTVPSEGLLLWLLRQLQAGRLDESEVTRGIDILLSFLARRQLAGYEPNLHRSIFASATKRLVNARELTGSALIDYLHLLLSDGDDVRTWPSNDMVRARAKTESIYSARRAHWTFSVLERINRGLFVMSKHVPSPLDREKYSVEHVMPQTLSADWRRDLQNWGVANLGQFHEERIHVLGNLTLTAINSELGNAAFTKKRELLRDDSLRLNAAIADAKSWSETTIDERSEQLAETATQVYVAPLTGKALDDARIRFEDLMPTSAMPEDLSDLDTEADFE